MKLAAQFAGSGTTIQGYFAAGDRGSLFERLERIRQDAGFRFLGLSDAKGRVVLRVSRPEQLGDDASSVGVVGAALSGKVASATEILSAGALNGGVLLTSNFAIGDRVWSLPFRGHQFTEVDSGSVTIFMSDLRISTNLRAAGGEHSVGTRAHAAVRGAVLKRPFPWTHGLEVSGIP